MNITLSWDLFVLVFFVVIVAYSFIVGRDNTLRIILGTYVSMIAADAAGILFGLTLGGTKLLANILRMSSLSSEKEAIVFVKLAVFVVFVVLFAIKGAFQVNTSSDRSPVVKIFLSAFYAVMSAGLIISAILVFISGVSFAGGGVTPATALFGVYNESTLIREMLNYSYVWFALPAFAFLLHSLYTKKSAE